MTTKKIIILIIFVDRCTGVLKKRQLGKKLNPVYQPICMVLATAISRNPREKFSENQGDHRLLPGKLNIWGNDEINCVL